MPLVVSRRQLDISAKIITRPHNLIYKTSSNLSDKKLSKNLKRNGSYQDRDNGGKTCCSYCFSFIFTAGLTSLFLWLSLRPDKPKCSIEYFYVPALNKSLDSHSRLNTTLNFIVRFANPTET